MASPYAHTAWSSGNLAVNAGAPAAGDVSRPRAIAACRRQRQPGTADGTPEAPDNRGISAVPASRSGRRHVGGPEQSRHLGGTGGPKWQAARRRPEAVTASCQLGPPPSSLRKCAVVFWLSPEENDEMTWHFSPAPSRGPILVWETAGRLVAVKRSTLRSPFLPRHFGSAN